MYNSIKKILAYTIPKSVLFKIEPFLRSIHALKFKGTKYYCEICDSSLNTFIQPLSICPSCGSLPRNRRLLNILKQSYLKPNINVLDFSPSRCLYRWHKKQNYSYTSSDLSGDFIADENIDITCIDKPDNTYNLVICYHILEHVIDDIQAMKELYRITKLNGDCIIQTPFKDGSIYEDYSMKSPVEREKHFGQQDHVRYYSINGLKGRLESVGFSVKTLSFSENKENYNGFNSSESVLICSKKE